MDLDTSRTLGRDEKDEERQESHPSKAGNLCTGSWLSGHCRRALVPLQGHAEWPRREFGETNPCKRTFGPSCGISHPGFGRQVLYLWLELP